MFFVLQFIILLISGLATMIQMKEHPMVIQTINTTKVFYQKLNITM